MSATHSVVRWLLGVCLLAACVSLPTSASTHELSLEFDAASVHTLGPSFDVVSPQDNAVHGRLGVGYTFPDDVVPGLRLHLLYGGGNRAAQRFDGDLEFDWNRNLYLTGLGWGYEVSDFFRPFVRTLFGYAQQRLAMDTESESYEQSAHDFAVLSSIGGEAYLPYKTDDDSFGLSRRFTLGLDAEVGYLWQTAATYRNMQRSSDDWNRSGADLGTLDTNGVFWTFGLFGKVRF